MSVRVVVFIGTNEYRDWFVGLTLDESTIPRRGLWLRRQSGRVSIGRPIPKFSTVRYRFLSVTS